MSILIVILVRFISNSSEQSFLLLLLLLKKLGIERLRESGIHHISPKNSAPQYQPINRKKRKGKRLEDYSRDRSA